MNASGHEGRSTAVRWLFAICLTTLALFFAVIPILVLLAPVTLIIAGFVYAATGRPKSVERSILSASGVVTATLFLAFAVAWTGFIVIPLAIGWDYGLSEFDHSLPVIALAVAPIGSLVIFVAVGAVMGAIGGVLAEVARDGAVCRAMTRARD